MTTLRNVLMINAISSGATGLILIVLPGFVAGLFETSSTRPFVGVGIFLVAFAILVFRASLQNPLRLPLVWLIIGLDSLWVIASLTVISFQLFEISTLGYVFIAAVAGWVALMAYLQFNGAKQLSMRSQQNQ